MYIDKLLQPILVKINFVERYLAICDKYSDYDSRMINVEALEIQKIIEVETVNFKFQRKERVFKIVDKFDDFNFQFNIKIDRGFLQFIWDLKKDKERMNLGLGMWENIVEELIKNEFQIKPRPYFGNYKDLQEILKEVFSIYNDFKSELLKQ